MIMRSVRLKFIAVIALCLIPMAAATRIFYWAAREEMREEALDQMQSARSAFTLEFQDDLSTLRVAARLIASDPDLARELAAGARPILHEHIDDFSDVYPEVRIYLTDSKGELLASSKQADVHGSLSQMPEMQQALQGRSFAGITRLVVQWHAPPEQPEPPLQSEANYSYALARPIESEGKRVGALLASFPLDRGYLDNTEQKEGLALALKIGDQIIASNQDHPAPDAKLKDGALELRSLRDGREVALASFAPQGLGVTPGLVTVIASKDVTRQFRNAERWLDYRLIALGVIALLAIGAGLFIANHIVQAIQKIASVLPGVALKKYERVEGVRTGDELQALAETYNHMIAALREGERQREQLGKYLSRAARDAVDRGSVDLGGTTMPATVLFSDIRGFTSLSEKMEPERVLVLLNRYFTEMVGAVVRHRGIVDKFMGDCIMAVWGPPTAQEDDALNAVRAALQMRERLVALNAQFVQEGLPELRTGIGIHTGPVVAGNMGAASTAELEGKMEYTVIGDTVNLASRLESLTKEMHVDVLLSEDTYRLVAAQVEVEALAPIKVRGREQAVAIYRLIKLATPAAQAALPAARG